MSESPRDVEPGGPSAVAPLPFGVGEEPFRNIAGLLMDVMFVTGIDGVLGYISPSANRVFGWTPQEMTGRHFTAFIPEGEISKALSSFRDALASSEGVRDLVLAMKRQDGSVFPGELSASAFRKDGAVGGVVGIIRDITERKRADDALIEERARLSLALDASQAGTWEWDLRTNRNFWSDELWKVYGLEPHCCEPSYEAWRQVVHPEDRPLAERTVQAAAAHGTELNFEFRVQDRDGGVRWLMSRGRPLRDAEGNVARFIGIVVDISDRKRAEQALRDSEERRRALITEMSNGFALHELICDEEGKPVDYVTLEVNRAFELLMKTRREDVVGRNASEILSPPELSQWLECFGPVALTCASTHYEMYSPSNQRHYEGAAYCPAKGRFAVTFGDITERKQAEEALRASEERFAAFMSNLPAAAFVKDEGGRTLFANQYLQELLSFENWEGRTTPSLVSGDVGRRMAEDDRRALAQGPLKVQETILDSHGVSRTFETIKFPIRLGRETTLLGGIATDITDLNAAANALRESEAKFRAMFMNSPDALYTASLEDGRVTDINNRFERLFGYSRDEVISRTSLQLCLYANPADRARMLAELRTNGVVEGFETEGRKKSGELFACSLSVSEMSMGGEKQIAGAIRDITAVKHAALALRRNETVLGALLRISQHRADSVRELLDYALSEALTLTGSKIGYIYTYNEELREFTLNTWSKEVMAECEVADQQTCYELGKTGAWGEAVRQRKPIVMNDFQASHPLKKGYPDGHVPLARFMTVPVFKGDRIAAVVGVANKPADYDEADVLQLTLLMDGAWKSVDIKRTEQRLREANQQYFAVAKCLPDTIWSADLSGRFTYLSPSVERTHGWTVEEGLNLNWRDTVTPRHAVERERRLTEELERAASPQYDRNSVITLESEESRKDGAAFRAEVNMSFIWSDDGRPVGLTGVTRDITERKRSDAEQEKLRAQLAQAQKMESVGRLAGGVAHDFNNLLTVINGYSHMLLGALRTGDPLRESLEEIHKAGERAAGLTRQLLAFSRKQVLDPRCLNVNRVVAEMRPMLERLVGEDIEVRVSLQAEGATIHADSHQLEQVVMNLVVNARDAMPGVGRLLVETANVEWDRSHARSHPDARAGRWVMLTVSDTGVGMDEETKNRIFEPFFTTKGVGEGTGLGLSMVHGIVTQSGGFVEVSSEKNRGTTFRIYLPAVPEETADAARPPAATAVGGKETVLVVEDQAEVRRYAVAVLKGYGYRVIPAENAGEALLLCERERIDLVLTDVIMPNLSGRELAERLEILRPGIKVLFMSGYTDNVIGPHGVLQDGAKFIQKPFSPLELAGKVRAALAPAMRTARILVADDEAAVRGFLRNVLVRGGYEVIEAADGKQAFRQASAGQVDLVITDLMMPEQEGIETIQALRRDLPGVGIIAISGAIEGAFLKMARVLGADAVLGKPVTAELLLTRVAEVLKTRR